MDMNVEKLKLIEWISELEDEEIMELLKAIKKTYSASSEEANEGVVNDITAKYSTKDTELNKQDLFKQLKDLPDNFSLDFLVDRLIFLKKLNVGLEQSKRGEGITDEEMDVLMQSWFK